MTLFIRRIVDVFTWMANLYYSRKYRAIAEQMGRNAATPNDRKGRGFIIIQVDGLSYEHLIKAIRKGYVPQMRRMIERGGLRLGRWRCGLPSSTPAVQAGIMFGDNFDIPAYRWFEKDAQRYISSSGLGSVGIIQSRASARRVGILKGGSSYMNVLDGDANLSLFTMGAVGQKRFFENVRGIGFLILFLFSPLRLLKVILLSIWDYASQVVRQTISPPPFRRRLTMGGLYPFLRIINNIIFREIQTFGVMIDIYRGIPTIYTNYNGYDEAAHHFGPDAPASFKVVRQIDKHIKQIDRMTRQYQRRQYDLFILSDHGMTPAVPFEKVYRESLGSFIARSLGDPNLLEEQTTSRKEDSTARFLIEELEGIEDRLTTRRGAAIVHRLRTFMDKTVDWEQAVQPLDMTKWREVIVSYSGCMANVYFNILPHKMDLSEIVTTYPGLLEKLLDHQGIGLIIGRQGSQTIVLSKTGTGFLGTGGRSLGKDPLQAFEEPKLCARQIARIDSFPHSGDLIIQGAFDRSTNQVVCFENQVGSHGGLGGPQSYPFILYPKRLSINLKRVENARDLYPFFIENYSHFYEQFSPSIEEEPEPSPLPESSNSLPQPLSDRP